MLYTYLAALALAAGALAAGCGSSSKTMSASSDASATKSASSASGASDVTNTESSKPLTRTEFIAKAEAICASTRAQLDSTSIKKQQDYALMLPQKAAYTRSAAAELTKLVPPTAMARDWASVIAGFETLATNTATAGEYLQSHGLSSATSHLQAWITSTEQLSTVAKHAGFKECSLI